MTRATAIAGIGATEFSKDSGRSELQLACEAVAAAIADAGLQPSDIDGLTTFTMDSSPEIDVARNVGLGELTFTSRVHYGGGAACATVAQAAMAVATGAAEVVVAYRAFNERSGRRFGTGRSDWEPSAEGVGFSWYVPFGFMTPAAWVAMQSAAYLHAAGADGDDLGRVSVAARRHAATNPAAHFHGRPITLDDHRASRPVVTPLRLLDCCQETDGGQAIVITSAERARDLPHPPAVIVGAAQGSGDGQEQMTSLQRGDLAVLDEAVVTARHLWASTGLSAGDISTAVLYDHFTPYVLMQLEAYGFCRRGEAKDLVADGGIELDGRLPVNTHGGQLGEAYLHGMNGVAEAVRQVRGTAVNQVDEVEHVLVTAGTGVPTSALVLGTDR
ncbi:lipid-transfer protein [Nitriliruptor alkaliphilus]|uniref:lipid-transfer protein n=1 Tax=Nitriliruptor alkaliphilus TaxID=427918 RepID=UPI000696548C|nr:lipid-transfer protein [Nitriliruptor alkaliphilus]